MNKTIFLSFSGEVNPEIRRFIEERFHQEVHTVSPTVLTNKGDLKMEMEKIQSQGSVITAQGELDFGTMQKIIETGTTITEIILHPLTKKPIHHVTHVPQIAR